MNKTNQTKFYKALGSIVKRQRLSIGHTFVSLSKEVDEQNKTIRSIESGQRCSLHHLTWIVGVLKIDMHEVYELMNQMEIDNGKEKISTYSDFI